jgi:hypothetical protein
MRYGATALLCAYEVWIHSGGHVAWARGGRTRTGGIVEINSDRMGKGTGGHGVTSCANAKRASCGPGPRGGSERERESCAA